MQCKIQNTCKTPVIIIIFWGVQCFEWYAVYRMSWVAASLLLCIYCLQHAAMQLLRYSKLSLEYYYAVTGMSWVVDTALLSSC